MYARYERLSLKVLWAEGQGSRKFHPVQWQLVTIFKGEGGLGVVNVRSECLALQNACLKFLEGEEPWWSTFCRELGWQIEGMDCNAYQG